jgi:acyl carrier protein
VNEHSDRTALEAAVLDIVRALVAELGGATAIRAPTLPDSLDRDLGISSLERVELLVRLERAFGVRLPDAVMAEAQTVAEIVSAIRIGSPSLPAVAPARLDPASPGAAAPASARTLVEVLRWHADRTPDRTHIHLRREDGAESTITYGRLLIDSTAVAAGLHDRGVVPGDPIVLMLRTEEAFFPALLGVLMARAIPVPIYPPVRADQLAEYARRQQAIVRNAGARVLITFGEAERMATVIRGQVPSLDTITTIEGVTLPNAKGPSETWQPDDPALIQYTSGSTGSPKGVVLSHANLLANIRAIGDGLAVQPDDVCVSWLPLYHDMGLIGAWLASLYFGVPVAIMSPLAFLARPSRWLWAIHTHRGTLSPAPNFAFDLTARKVPDDEIQGLDLGSLRLAVNGSEMIHPDTIDRFTRRFGRYGFRPEAMCPVYGLAESSVGLTMTPRGRLPRIDRIAREPFERARAVQEADPGEAHPLRFVSSGRPLIGHDVRIVDPSGQTVTDRQEGRIQFRGPSMTRGYFRNPDATNAVMHDGWMDSGDLGYRADGDLFITGREKDLIIQGGRNISAQEVEEAVAAVAGIRRGCVAAFGVQDPALGTERLVVVAETRDQGHDRRDALRQAVVERLVADLGIPPDAVVIAGPGTVLKTSSGKIRRSATRDAYISGTLGRTVSTARQWADLLGAALGDRARRLGQRVGAAAFTLRVATAVLLTVPVLWVSLKILPSGRQAGRAAQRWSRLMMALCGVPLNVTGLHHLKGITSGLLAANHASYIDPIVLMASIPADVGFIAKGRLADYPVIGTVIEKAGHLKIDKADLTQRLAGADEVVARLKEDGLLIVFPEGTFDGRRRLLPFRLGAFRAAVETERPIVPIALRGTRDMLPDGTWLFRRGAIDVVVGEPLRPRAQGWPEMVRLRDETREVIARGSGEPLG